MALTVNNLIMVRCQHTATTGVTESYTMARSATALDIVVSQQGANNRTVTLGNSGVPISAALGAAGNNLAVRPATNTLWDSAAKVLAVGDTLDFTINTDDDGYNAYAYLYPTPGAVT